MQMIINIIIIISLLLSSFWVLGNAQVDNRLDSTKTYGLFVGISNYQNFSSLKYAHKDAQDLKNYLSTKLNFDDYSVITDSQATRENILEYLDKLTDNVKPGDKVYVFFSGHGDIENKVILEKGYLIAYDTPLHHYNIKGVSTNELNEYLSILVNGNKANVYLFVDMCRAALVNKIENGPGQSLTALMNQNKNLAKFASCKADEKSIERYDLNNGQGLFTYALIQGLTCLSDVNKDELIQHEELRRFLFDEVRSKSKSGQTPMISGDDPNMLILECLSNSALEPKPSSLSNTSTSSAQFGRPQPPKDPKKEANINSFQKNSGKKIEIKKPQIPNDAIYFFDSKTKSQILQDTLKRRQLIFKLQRYVEDKLLVYVDSDISQLIDTTFRIWILSPKILDTTIQFLKILDTILPTIHPLKAKSQARSLFFRALREPRKQTSMILLDKSIELENDAAYAYFLLEAISKLPEQNNNTSEP